MSHREAEYGLIYRSSFWSRCKLQFMLKINWLIFIDEIGFAQKLHYETGFLYFSYMIRLCAYFFDLTKENAPTIFWCLQQFFMLLYYTNFSINFLLYAMCGITFRRCLWHFITGCIERYTPYTCSPVRYI